MSSPHATTRESPVSKKIQHSPKQIKTEEKTLKDLGPLPLQPHLQPALPPCHPPCYHSRPPKLFAAVWMDVLFPASHLSLRRPPSLCQGCSRHAQPLCLLPAGLPKEDALTEPDRNFQSSCRSLLQTRVKASLPCVCHCCCFMAGLLPPT